MIKLTFEHDGSLTPGARGVVLAQVLHFMAAMMEPVPYGRLLAQAMEAFDAREEDVSATVKSAVHTLIRSGLITSNGYRALGNEESVMTFGAETTVCPARALTFFAFGEHA